MDLLVALLMIILFLVLLVFIFSMALLTPIIGKKNLLFVIFMGFMVGIVGGAFFIAPLYDDVPEMARGYYQYTSNANETIGVDVSTNIDITDFMDSTSKLTGVLEVYSNGIIIKTDPFTAERKKLIEEKIPLIDSNITSWKVDNTGVITLTVKKGYNPETAIKNLGDWMMLTGGINTKYSMVHVSIIAQASQVNSIIKSISQQQIVVTGVQGPVEDKINWLNEVLPDKSNIILFCGFLGLIVGLAGVFIDSIILFVKDLKKKALRKRDEE
jgi:hypothetical protein